MVSSTLRRKLVENKNLNEQKNIVLAFFDILGTSEKIKQEQYDKVYDFYHYMVNLCSEELIPLSFYALPGDSHDATETVVRFPMNHAFFSDTFIVWVEYYNLFGMSSHGFFEKCMEIFIEALKHGIPLRGAISRGSAIMDIQNNLYLGKPIVEAARAESAQNWLGIALTRSFQETTVSEAHLLLPYHDHINEKYIEKNKEILFVQAVLDWPKYWRNNENNSPIPYIQAMNTDANFSSYYDNAMKFVNYSLENQNFWDNKIPPLPPMRPKIVRYE